MPTFLSRFGGTYYLIYTH